MRIPTKDFDDVALASEDTDDHNDHDEDNAGHKKIIGNFLLYTLGTPPNPTKLFTGLLQPTFKEGTGSFVWGPFWA